MVNGPIAKVLDFLSWLYLCDDIYTIKNVLDHLDIKYTDENVKWCEKFLEYNQLAYKLNNGYFKYWINRKTVFDQQLFSIKPTAFEIKKGLFIPGTRCEPYINNFFRESPLKLIFHEEVIERTLILIPLKEIRKYYYMISDENLFEELGTFSPLNTMSIEDEISEKELFYIPSYDIKKYYKDFSFTEEDQIVFKVSSWENKDVQLYSKMRHTMPDSYQEQWEIEFKKNFTEGLSYCQAEKDRIIDVVSYALCLGRDLFFNQGYLIPVQEYLEKKQMLEDLRVGVLDVKWAKDNNSLPVEDWFHYIMEVYYIVKLENNEERFFCSLNTPINSAIIEIYVYDFIERNYIKLKESDQPYCDICAFQFIEEFFPNEKYEKYYKKISSIIKRNYKRYLTKYEPFKEREELDLGFGIFSLFKRVYAIVEYLKKIKITPHKLDPDICAIINQMTKDMSDAMDKIKMVLHGKAELEKVKEGIFLLTERLIEVVKIVEDFISFEFGNR